MQYTDKQLAIFELIKVLKESPQGTPIRKLAERLSCDTRTIKNYYDELCHEDMSLNFIEDVRMARVRRGIYTIEDNRIELSDTSMETEKKVFIKLALESLENLSDLSQHYEEIEEELKLNHIKTPYYIKSEEYQKLNTDEEEIEKLEEAILNDNIIAFTFRGKDFHVEPYRLVNFDGIWYLYGKDREEKEENAYKTWLLKHIDNVEIFYTETHDLDDEEIEEDLDEAESASFIPDHSFEVKVKVHTEAADLFLAKNYLPKQQMQKHEDGSLIVTTDISTYEDVDKIIKSWIPHIEILSPVEYKERFREELSAYVSQLEEN